jgi:hypothetical protein
MRTAMTELHVTGKESFNRMVFIFFLLFCTSLSVAEAKDLFEASEQCAFCHTSSSNALIDSQGNDLSIYHDWGSTMMANSFRDPVFRAKLESEQKRNPHLSAEIEDKCLTCHTPMARAQYIRDGGEHYTVEEAEQSSLASDGVGCTLCHQIQPVNLGKQTSFSGHYSINDSREIYGPYKDVFENPMLHHVSYRPVFGAQVHESALCGSCHTLFTPYLDNMGKIAGEFPEQTPYLEWLNSSYASADSSRSCQDCHMPRIDEPIRITNRPPWLENKHSPFWKHHFTGGNSFVLEMMQEYPEQTLVSAADEDFRLTIQRTKRRLTGEAAAVSLEAEFKESNRLRLVVTVKNKTGHKFPSGFPVRRAWLQVQVRDKSDTLLFDSGSWDENGEINGLDPGFEPHYDLITTGDQVQIYQAIMGDIDNNPTYTLLRSAGYLKDNRLLPDGYSRTGPMAEYTKVTGKAHDDKDYNKEAGVDSSGTDRLTYDLAVDKDVLPLNVQARLLYQSVPPRFIGDLLEDQTPATRRLGRMYSTMNREPIVVDSQSRVIE